LIQARFALDLVGEGEHQHEPHRERRENAGVEFRYHPAQNVNGHLRLGEAATRIMHLNSSGVIRHVEIRMCCHRACHDRYASSLGTVIVAIKPVVRNQASARYGVRGKRDRHGDGAGGIGE